jgi:crotonobetaine/carnitine-CoA ligase
MSAVGIGSADGSANGAAQAAPDGAKFPRDKVVIRDILERQAKAMPQEICVTFEDGSSWTRLATLHAACSAAHALRDAGVGQGDRIAILYQNGPEFIRAWWGSTMLGAVLVPIHTGYHGAMLEHLLRLARPAALVADPALMRVFDEVTDASIVPRLRLTGADLQSGDHSLPALDRPIETWDTQVCLLTSGTTGPSKLAACTYRNVYVGGCNIIAPLRGTGDRLLIDIPLFHGGAIRTAVACLSTGASMAIRSMPRVSNYWEVLKETGATMSMLVSSMVDMVLAQPPCPAEREHKVRAMSAVPLPRDIEGFKKRFGVERLYVVYGSTEVPGSLGAAPDDVLVDRYCGRQQPGYELRIVDENDLAVPDGQPGELIVRHAEPWVIAHEYINNPVATATAWRNGWFHTGDMLRCEPDGRFFYVDRAKDSLRRRGENISSTEVEAEVLTFPGVKEAACVACRLPSQSDDEVKVWIVPHEGQGIDWSALLRHCAARLPYFMVPRFFELADALPRTHNLRVRKLELRERGNGGVTWDREAHGFTVTRQGLGEKPGSQR